MARSAINRVHLRKFGNFSVEGLDEAYDKIEKVLDRVQAEKLKGTFMKAAVIARDRAKALAPVRTGRLRDAIFAAPGDPTKANVLVGVNRSSKRSSKTGIKTAPHGILLEYGTSKMSARPFFRPAIAETREKMATTISTGIKEAIQEAAK